MDVSLDVCVDDGISDDAEDDSILFTEEISSGNFFEWGNDLRFVSIFLHGRSLTDLRSCFYLVVHGCATAHLTNLVLGIVFGGLAKLVGS